MNKNIGSIAVVLFLCTSVFAQHTAHKAPTSEKPIALLNSRGFVSHKVSTKKPDAQRYFDQGLSLYFAFNEVDAARSFVRATEIDPDLAIAWWGVALAKNGLGNAKSGAVRDMKAANDPMRKALSLTSPPNERSFIEALAKLIPGETKAKQSELYIAYRDAMAEVYKRQPDDPDAATLYAMSIGNTGPFWGKWRKDGTAVGGTGKMVDVLETGLKKHPTHLGLTHMYIHAVEDSPTPERALAAANSIRSLNLDQPELGHIIHMPSHIYLRMGDYKTAAEANEVTANAPMNGLTEQFRRWHYGHVYAFLIYSYSMQGNYAKVRNALERVFDLNFPNASAEERIYRGNDVNQLVRFRKWDEILKLPVDPERPSAWHWARALAHLAKKDIPAAEAERKALVETAAAEIEMMSKMMPPEQFAKISEIGKRLDIILYSKLDAAIAVAKGDREAAVELLKTAIVEEDQVDFNEPPIIQDPTRETLGGLLFQMGKFAEAEKVFREDLKYTRNNGRSLFGLWKTLEAQKKTKEAARVEKQFREAWKYADTKLRIEDL